MDGVEHCVVFNVGDSRVYRLVDGDFAQVSVDHSEVQELQDAGQISAEAAAYYPRRNIITRCLGTDPAPMPDVWVFVPSPHERFVICSDGLSGEVDDAAIAATIQQAATPKEAAESLLQQALDGGGRDNVTVIVVDMNNGAPEQSAAGAPGGQASADSADVTRPVSSEHAPTLEVRPHEGGQPNGAQTDGAQTDGVQGHEVWGAQSTPTT